MYDRLQFSVRNGIILGATPELDKNMTLVGQMAMSTEKFATILVVDGSHEVAERIGHIDLYEGSNTAAWSKEKAYLVKQFQPRNIEQNPYLTKGPFWDSQTSGWILPLSLHQLARISVPGEFAETRLG
jgi:hypothetical protein